MDVTEFVENKRAEILALAQRHRASEIRIVKSGEVDLSGVGDGIKLVASFPSDSQRSNYFDVLVEFQEDLESWLGVKVHVYDANGFKGADGSAFLADTLPL